MSPGKPDDDRDELVVELLTRIVTRLDAMEDSLAATGKTTKDLEAIDPKIVRAVLVFLGKLDKRTIAIDEKIHDPGQPNDALQSALHRTVQETLAPILEHIDGTSEWAKLYRRNQKEELVQLRRANRTWLWAAPSLALTILIIAALAARLAMNTATGCTALGGKYEATGRGFVDLCFFAAGGW